MFIIHRLHEHDFRANILCDLLDLKFPEMGGLDLDLSARYGNDAVFGRLHALSNFLAFTYIDLHGLFLHAITAPEAHQHSRVGYVLALIYQLVYMGLYLFMVIDFIG